MGAGGIGVETKLTVGYERRNATVRGIGKGRPRVELIVCRQVIADGDVVRSPGVEGEEGRDGEGEGELQVSG